MGNSELKDVAALAKEIRERLRSLVKFDAESIRAVRRGFSRRLRPAEPRLVVDLACLLVKEPRFEYRLVASELLHHHPALHTLRARELKKLGQGMNSWGAVDIFAIYLAGPVWRERRVPNTLIHGWARLPDRWWRRAALVSTVPLNSKAQGGHGDTHRTLEVCRLLESDRDPLVLKALSWALRELSKRDARAVREYLRERGSRLAPRVLREVRNKLATGLKNPGQLARSVAEKGDAEQ